MKWVSELKAAFPRILRSWNKLIKAGAPRVVVDPILGWALDGCAIQQDRLNTIESLADSFDKAPIAGGAIQRVWRAFLDSNADLDSQAFGPALDWRRKQKVVIGKEPVTAE